MEESRESKFAAVEEALGYSFAGEIKIGGNYVSAVQHGDQVFISGQIPRVGNEVVVTGAVGTEVSVTQAQLAAKVCTMRVLRITVFVQSAQGFTQQSEIADGSSEVLYSVLGSAGVHTRTSVGVLQLPKNAAVELDLIAAVEYGIGAS